MPKLGFIVSCISVIILTFSQSALAEPRLRSLAIHTELGQELFIGALFSDAASAAPEVLQNPQEAARLEIKILAEEGFSARRFARLWIESIAINQTAAALGAQAQNVISFDQLFTTRLVKNDHLVITNTPSRGLNISLNGTALGSIEDNQFFPVLLSSWIGRVPLSSSFRESILSVHAPDAGVESRFLSLQPTSARRQQIASLSQQSSSAQAVIEAAEVVAEKPAIEKAEIEKPVIEKPVLEKPVSAPMVVAPAPVVAAPAPVANAPAPSSASADEDDAQPMLTAQTLLARQYYLNDAIVKINQKIRYPTRALKRRQEGSVRLKVTLDRRGNILNTVFLETSEHVLLNKEAASAVNQADPLPPVPDAITGNTVDVIIPLRFKVPRK